MNCGPEQIDQIEFMNEIVNSNQLKCNKNSVRYFFRICDGFHSTFQLQLNLRHSNSFFVIELALCESIGLFSPVEASLKFAIALFARMH